MIREKHIIIGRHGAKYKPKEGEDKTLGEALSNESIGTLYSQGVDLEKENGLTNNPERILTFNSQRPRTTATNLGRIAGILGLMPVPRSQADVLNDNPTNASLQFHPQLAIIPRTQHFGLGFYEGEMNVDAYMAAEKRQRGLGGKVCTEFGLQNPDAREHEGVRILPFGYIVAKSAGVIADAIKALKTGRADLVSLASHSVVTDAGVYTLIRSPEATSGFAEDDTGRFLRTCEDYGGAFNEEDYGVLKMFVYGNDEMANQAVFTRNNGFEAPVNLGNFLQLTRDLQRDYPVSLFNLTAPKQD